jgi:hypothetical protein
MQMREEREINLGWRQAQMLQMSAKGTLKCDLRECLTK